MNNYSSLNGFTKLAKLSSDKGLFFFLSEMKPIF